MNKFHIHKNAGAVEEERSAATVIISPRFSRSSPRRTRKERKISRAFFYHFFLPHKHIERRFLAEKHQHKFAGNSFFLCFCYCGSLNLGHTAKKN